MKAGRFCKAATAAVLAMGLLFGEPAGLFDTCRFADDAVHHSKKRFHQGSMKPHLLCYTIHER